MGPRKTRARSCLGPNGRPTAPATNMAPEPRPTVPGNDMGPERPQHRGGRPKGPAAPNPGHRAAYRRTRGPNAPEPPTPLPTLLQNPEDRALDLAAGGGVHEPQGHLAGLDEVVGVDPALGGRGAAGTTLRGRRRSRGRRWGGDRLVGLGFLELGGEALVGAVGVDRLAVAGV